MKERKEREQLPTRKPDIVPILWLVSRAWQGSPGCLNITMMRIG